MPSIDIMNIRTEAIVAAASKLDENLDNQDITPTDDPYDGEFSSKRGGRTVWDDDFEDEEE